MSKKEFYGEVSIIARLSFNIEAESEEEARRKIFEAGCPMSLVDKDGNKICEITDQNWSMVDNVRTGNVRESNIEDFYIEEE